MNKRITEWPHEDYSAKILDSVVSGGGSACNFAIDFLLLCPEAEAATIAVAGDDEHGRFLKDLAVRYAIDVTRFQLLAGKTTHYTDAYTSAKSGRRTHIYTKGCSDFLGVEHFNFDGLEDRFLHLGLSGNHAKLDEQNGSDATGWVTILRRAKQAGLVTNLETMSAEDPRRVADLNFPSLPFLDLLIVNDWEIQALAGRAHGEITNSVNDVVAAAKTVLEAGAMEMVVVHEPSFAVCVTRDSDPIVAHSTPVPTEFVVGTNGAGDAFAAGFVCGLQREAPVVDCLAYGHAAAAASMRDITPYEGVHSIEECIRLVQSFPRN